MKPEAARFSVMTGPRTRAVRNAGKRIRFIAPYRVHRDDARIHGFHRNHRLCSGAHAGASGDLLRRRSRIRTFAATHPGH